MVALKPNTRYIQDLIYVYISHPHALPATTTIKSGKRRICKTALRFDDVLPIRTSEDGSATLHNRTPVRSVRVFFQSWSWPPVLTCRGFGFLEQHTIIFNSWFYYDSPSLGEYLLRCGIDISIYMNITIQHTEQLVHVENTS